MSLTRSSFAPLILSALAFTLSACGGQSLVFNGNEPSSSGQTVESSSEQASSEQTSSEQASSEQSSQTSSTTDSSTSSLAGSSVSSVASSTGVSSSISSVASSSKSSSLSSSSLSGPTAVQLYTNQCASCHGSNGQGGNGGGELLNCARCNNNLSDLIGYIDREMPLFSADTCDATCAQKLGTYIFYNFNATASAELPSFLKQTAPTTAEFSLLANSDSSCSVAYSENDLRPLTKQEYANSILRLTGIDLINSSDQSAYAALPPDNLVSAFYNNETIVIDSDTKRAYQKVASIISEQLYAQNFNGLVDCSNSNSEECYNKLIDDFACKTFRRPLTAEERATYQPLFVGDKKDGIKNIINVLLSSPEFIYRSNIGLTLVNPAAETALVDGAPLINNVKTIRIYEKENLNASLTGNDVLEIAVKATQSPTGLWPVMRVQVGQTTFVDLVVKHADTQIYRLHVTGLTGNNSVSIINQQTGAALEYQTGHNLVVSSVKLLSSD